MARPVTLFTGQRADMPLAEVAPLAKRIGYDGLELACWGDHFDVHAALDSPRYVKDKRDLPQNGTAESAAFCHRLDFAPAAGAFDAAFDKKRQAM